MKSITLLTCLIMLNIFGQSVAQSKDQDAPRDLKSIHLVGTRRATVV